MDRWLERFARANFVRSNDTAHDLKTPLNVAVLNLELLRMRVRKLTGEASDEKLSDYVSAIETELRRMASIFDVFFILSTPPKEGGAPELVDAGPLIADAAAIHGFEVATSRANVVAHEARIAQAFRVFFEGVAKLLVRDGGRAEMSADAGQLLLTIRGIAAQGDLELTRIFKFYYSDQDGNADLSLATARLIVETYGGELSAESDGEEVLFRLMLPLGDE